MKNILLIGASSDVALSLIEEHKHNYHFIKLSRDSSFSDVSDFDVMNEKTYFKTEKKFDGMVYFPGTINLKPFDSLSIEDFKNDLNINFIGLVKVLKFYKRNFNNNSSFIFISSIAAKKGMPFHSSISSAKSAIIGLTRSLASEWAPKYRVNCILPSIFESNMSSRILRNDKIKEKIRNNHPLKRYGNVNDISSIIHFLLSDDSSWITGQEIAIDGGLSSID